MSTSIPPSSPSDKIYRMRSSPVTLQPGTFTLPSISTFPQHLPPLHTVEASATATNISASSSSSNLTVPTPMDYTPGTTSPLTPASELPPISTSPSLRSTPALPSGNNMASSSKSVVPIPGIADRSRLKVSPSFNKSSVGSTSMSSTAPMGYQVLGDDMKDMVNTINKLRAAGVENMGLPLPRIAVIGNQSAGKSSLIEAISGIQVPRNQGTCTRCPIEITLIEDTDPIAPWTCRISLRFNKKYVPRRNGKGDPWVDAPHTQVNFLDIFDKEEVTGALVRAQLAILNPSKPWGEFVAVNVNLIGDITNTEVKFSPNVICMEISGNNVPNLSFIDLPGIIHVTERKEEEYLIRLVKNLVESYIKEEDCLILLAMTMKDDAVNQSAAQMARRFGPNRTIGALTKPDTVNKGEYDQWIRILRGQEHRLPHGYFVTKQLSQTQLMDGFTHEQAREYERQFFESMEPWSDELQDLSNRFGTINLQRYLSKQLANLIRQRLPSIINLVQQQEIQVQQELESLPPPPADNLRVILRNLLDNYFFEVRTTVDNRSRGDDNSFSYNWRKTAERLKTGLIALRPRLNHDESSPRPSRNSYSVHGTPTPNPLYGSFSSGGGSPPDGSASKSRKRPASFDEPPDEASDPFGGSASGGPARKKQAVDPRTPVKAKIISIDEDDIIETESVIEPTHKQSTPMHLLQVRDVLERNMTTHIPQAVDPQAVENLSKMHIQLWDPCVKQFISQMDELLYNHTYSIFAKHFKRYEGSPLYANMTEHLTNWHNLIMGKVKKMVMSCFSIEAECVYTLQDKEWSREYAYWRNDNHTRRQRAVEEQKVMRLQRMQERAAQQQQPGKKVQKVELPDREGPDPFHREIETMINAQAYCSIARKRFGDQVMMRMMRKVFTKYTTLGTFKEYMETEMEIHAAPAELERRCAEWMVQDPAIERRRTQLMKDRQLLEDASRALAPFTSSY